MFEKGYFLVEDGQLVFVFFMRGFIDVIKGQRELEDNVEY